MGMEITYHIPRPVEGFKKAWADTALDLKDVIIEKSQDLIVAGPFNEGNLHGSATWWQEDDMTWYVGYSAPYAKFVEFGTAPHYPPLGAIRDWARTKFGIFGARLERAARGIAWKIFHHGTKPQPFLRPAVEMARPMVGRLYKKNLVKRGLAR